MNKPVWEGKITFKSTGGKTIAIAELVFENGWVWKVALGNLASATVQFADLPAFIESLGDEDD